MDTPTSTALLVAFFCLLTILLVSIISYLLFYYVLPVQRPQPKEKVIERSTDKSKMQMAKPQTVAVEVDNPTTIKLQTVNGGQSECPHVHNQRVTKLQEPSKDVVTVAKVQTTAYEQVNVRTVDGDDPIKRPKYCERTQDADKVVDDILAVFDKQVREPTQDVTAKVEDHVKAAEKVITMKMPEVPRFEVTATHGQVPQVQYGLLSVERPKYCVKSN